MKFGVSSWHGSRVDGRSYLLSGAIDGSEANTRIDADFGRLVSFDDFFRKARGVERLQELQDYLEKSEIENSYVMSPMEEYESHVKMIVESLKEEKMYVKFSNNLEAEHRGSYLD
ncbi:hypothetical protein Tco_0049503, partial [Tanacetum coccineum]